MKKYIKIAVLSLMAAILVLTLILSAFIYLNRSEITELLNREWIISDIDENTAVFLLFQRNGQPGRTMVKKYDAGTLSQSVPTKWSATCARIESGADVKHVQVRFSDDFMYTHTTDGPVEVKVDKLLSNEPSIDCEASDFSE